MLRLHAPFPLGQLTRIRIESESPRESATGQTRGPRLARLKSGNALDPKNQRVDSLASMEIAEPHFLDSAMAFLTRNGTPGRCGRPLKRGRPHHSPGGFSGGEKNKEGTESDYFDSEPEF